jgi:hypothetical protein
MLVLKLALVAASVLLATLAAKRFGHAIGGAVAGMPMIAAPIMAILLIDHSAAQVQAIALATLACVPATIAHIVTFAHAARRWSWPVGLMFAFVSFGLFGAMLTNLPLPVFWTCAVALAAPAIGLRVAPRGGGPAIAVAVPHIELVLRIAAAVLMAAVIILGADALPAAVNGLLLAVPITGTILPCFTQARYGPDATVSLMSGFVRGLHGFAVFFVVLYFALGQFSRTVAFCLALAAALAIAIALQGLRRAKARSGSSLQQ